MLHHLLHDCPLPPLVVVIPPTASTIVPSHLPSSPLSPLLPPLSYSPLNHVCLIVACNVRHCVIRCHIVSPSPPPPLCWGCCCFVCHPPATIVVFLFIATSSPPPFQWLIAVSLTSSLLCRSLLLLSYCCRLPVLSTGEVEDVDERRRKRALNGCP